MNCGVNRNLVADTTSDEAIFASLSASAAHGALFDSHLWDPQEQRGCLEGTRTSIFERIDRALDTSSNTIIWLSGSPRTGKSAIAHTVARRLEAQSRLAGTFFFSSKYHHISGMAGLGAFVPTLAYQLSKSEHMAKDIAVNAIRSDPAILDPMKPLSAQFKELLVKPLENVQVAWRRLKPKVMVIDAIDACEEGRIFELISCLANLLRELHIPNLHICITSRPLRAIDAAFKFIGGSVSITRIALDDADQAAEVREDICLFFRRTLERSYEYHGIEYPGAEVEAETIHCLAHRANGRFGTASTMIKFLETNTVLHFNDKLDILKDPGNQYLHHTQVFCFYEFIINLSENPSRAYRHLSTVVNLAEPLAPTQLQKLLGPPESDLLPILVASSPIVCVPADDSRAVEVLHITSLSAFLSQHSSQHSTHAFQLLAHSSLRVMKGAFQRQSNLKPVLERMIPFKMDSHSESILVNFLESCLAHPCNVAIHATEWYNEYMQSRAGPIHVAPSCIQQVVNSTELRSSSGAYSSTTSHIQPCDVFEDIPKALLAVKKFRAKTKFHDLDVFELLGTLRAIPQVLFFLILLGIRHGHPLSSHDIDSVDGPPKSHVPPAFQDFMQYVRNGSERSMKSPTALQHACRYWGFYLSRDSSMMDECLRTFLSAFWQDKLLSWFEQQWRLGGLESCIEILCVAQDIDFNEKTSTPRAVRWINNVISRMSSEIRS